MSGTRSFGELSREARIALCREVMDGLSDLVEGTAPAELCERVERLLGDCQPYRACRNTLEATLMLLRECGERDAPLAALDPDRFRQCVERVRDSLRRGTAGDPGGGRRPGSAQGPQT